MKTATIPSLRVEPALRSAAENLIKRDIFGSCGGSVFTGDIAKDHCSVPGSVPDGVRHHVSGK